MPTIEVNYNDLLSLIGEHVPLDVLQDEGMMYAKSDIESIDGEKLRIDVKDTNRPDLWSAEGIARELSGRYGARKGLPAYAVRKSDLVVTVDRKLARIRPLTVCAVVKGLNITPDVLSQMIQLQEKVSITFGKNRKEVAIGVYDYHKITPPIRFTSVKPDGIRFVPLEFDESLTPAQILKKHPKGREYAHLLAGMKEYPIFIDAAGQVLSMPPVINSDYTGKVTSATRDIFIECSGFDFRFLVPALNVLAAAFADRGGDVYSVRVEYPDTVKNTPDMRPKKASVDIAYANAVSGLGLTPKQACTLLEQARYSAKASGRKINVLYPAYRQDIMHQRDVIEDMIISYGYRNIRPTPPRTATSGSLLAEGTFADTAAEVMTGLGFQETLSYILTNKGDLFQKMCAPEQDVVEIENYVSSNWCVFRNSVLPGLMDFLSRNKHREYPQKIFETGDIVLPDPKAATRAVNARRMAAALCDTSVGYEHMASVLSAFLDSLGVGFRLIKADAPEFIPGRAAEIATDSGSLGAIGEVHPQVLNNWGIEKPVAAFEIDMDMLMSIVSRE